MRTAAPQYIKARRAADPEWVRRNKRSLGRNKHFRACVRMRLEAKKALDKLLALREADSLADRINARLSQFLGRAAQVFTHRAQAR